MKRESPAIQRNLGSFFQNRRKIKTAAQTAVKINIQTFKDKLSSPTPARKNKEPKKKTSYGSTPSLYYFRTVTRFAIHDLLPLGTV